MAGRSAQLTKREQEVLALILQGWVDKAIAAQLGMSCATVRTHVARLKEKLDVTTRAQFGEALRATEDRRQDGGATLPSQGTDGHDAADGSVANRAIGQSGNRAIGQ